MALVQNTAVKPWIAVLRGATESDIVKLHDTELYGQGNGIYANITEAHVTSISAFLDGVVKSCLLGSGVKLTDENAVRQKDTDITDAKGVSLTITFANGMKAKPYIPMAKIASIPAMAMAIAKLPWRTPEGADLVATSVDYKVSVQVV